MHTDNASKADILNQQFAPVFTHEDLRRMPLMGNSPYPDIPDIIVHTPGVAKLLSEQKPHKASGPDEISSKLCAQEIAPASACYSKRHYPSELYQIYGRKL